MELLRAKEVLLKLQDRITHKIELLDTNRFLEDDWVREQGGGGRTRVLANGSVIEKGGVNFSHIFGDNLPSSASLARPELAGRSFEAMGVSVVMHPNNPYAPTSHLNVRLFVAQKEGSAPVWWVGGGFDLTPYYGFDEDCIFWHQTAKIACDKFDQKYYPEFKDWCDRYFYLKHRKEPRGIGGIFFDDQNTLGFDRSIDFLETIGDAYLEGYLPILQKRHLMEYSDQQRSFQLMRRGRYVEFNLVFDRGTLFGLQSGGRTESILMSLPPAVHWEYQHQPTPGSPEARLTDYYLRAKDWLASAD